jgi:hypothetical protein
MTDLSEPLKALTERARADDDEVIAALDAHDELALRIVHHLIRLERRVEYLEGAGRSALGRYDRPVTDVHPNGQERQGEP